MIDYPDAPLPGGRLQMRVLVDLDAEGRVDQLANNADPTVPLAFFDAVKRGLSAATFSPGFLRHRAVASNLCLEVLFDEQSPRVKATLLEGSAGSRERCLSR